MDYSYSSRFAIGLSFELLKKLKKTNAGMALDVGYSRFNYTITYPENFSLEEKSIAENDFYLGVGFIQKFDIKRNQRLFYSVKYRPGLRFNGSPGFNHGATASLGFALNLKKPSRQNKTISIEAFAGLLEFRGGVKREFWSHNGLMAFA